MSSGIAPVTVYSGNTLIYNDRFLTGEGTPSENKYAEQLASQVHTIAGFFWLRFHNCGINAKGEMPNFYLQGANTSYNFSARDQFFEFEDKHIEYGEVVAHEFMHGVTRWLNPLAHFGEAGALGESISDVFGIVYKRSILKQKDWKVGNLRDLEKPYNMKLLDTKNEGPSNDYGHVHDNSLIPSRAFYLVASAFEGFDPNYEVLLKIWWQALRELGPEEKNFKGFAEKTKDVAFQNGGEPYIEALQKAWQAVGVLNNKGCKNVK